MKPLQPIIDSLPRLSHRDGGSIENRQGYPGDGAVISIMIALTLLIIILQVRSLSAMVMVFPDRAAGADGVVPTLLLFNQPFGINATGGLIALWGS